MSRKEETKEKIIRSAQECFNKTGYINTSMNDIVKQSGISKGGIYWHFKSKEEIFVQMIEVEYDKWLTDVKNELSKYEDPIDKLRAYGHYFFVTIDSPIWRMLPQSYWGELGEHYLQRLNNCYNKDDEIVRDLLKEAVDKKLTVYDDIEELTWIYVTTIEGLFAKIALDYKNEKKLKKYISHAIDMFINGIIKNPK